MDEREKELALRAINALRKGMHAIHNAADSANVGYIDGSIENGFAAIGEAERLLGMVRTSMIRRLGL